MPIKKTLAALVAVAFLVIPAAGAVDDMQAVAAVWNDFVAAVRRGDYPNAHAMFSAESRAAMPYREFVGEYGPLSAAREMVLAKPESLSTQVDDDWAEIAVGGFNPGTGRRFRVGVALARNDGLWGLVAARNETAERLEAEARGVLRIAATWRGLADADERMRILLTANADSPVLRFFRFQGDGESFRALPLEQGLRAFFVDARGEVREVGSSAPSPTHAVPMPLPPGRPAPLPDLTAGPEKPPPAPAERPLVNGLPEITEPPMAPPSLAPPDEMPAPGAPAPFFFDEPRPSPVILPHASGAVTLPDSIE